jgi:hypothetical protein
MLSGNARRRLPFRRAQLPAGDAAALPLLGLMTLRVGSPPISHVRGRDFVANGEATQWRSAKTTQYDSQ